MDTPNDDTNKSLNEPEAGPRDVASPSAARTPFALSRAMRDAMPFARFSWQRFKADRLTRVAASLSFTSLLALVPLLAVAFSVLAAFPLFKGARAFAQDYMLQNLMPKAGVTVSGYIDAFLANTDQLTAFGLIGLAVSAVLLLNTIEGTFNIVFRAARPRALAARLVVFFAFLTVGPVLLGASFLLSTFVFAATTWVDQGMFSDAAGLVTRALPTALMIMALTLFYIIIPNRRVRFGDAVLGAVVAGALFTVVRALFGLYMGSSSAMQTIYGAAATVPAFLIWMFLTWCVILFGAEITAGNGEWRRRRRGLAALKDNRDGALELSMRVVVELHENSQRSGGLTLDAMMDRTGRHAGAIEATLRHLRENGVVRESRDGQWRLARDPGSLTLAEILEISDDGDQSSRTR